MHHLSIKTRLTLLTLFAILMLVLVAAGGWIGVGKVESALRLLGEEKLPTANLLSDIRSRTATLRAASLEAALWRTQQWQQARFKNIHERVVKTDQELTTALTAYGKLPLSSDEAAAWAQFSKIFKNWHGYAEQTTGIIGQLADNTDSAKQAELFEQYDTYNASWVYVVPGLQDTLNKLVAANAKATDAARQEGADAQRLAIRFILASLGAAVIVLLLLSTLIARGIVTSLGRMRNAIVAVAQDNDFTIRAAVSSRDEAGQTADAFNRLLEKMQASLRQVLHNANQVSEAARQASDVAERVSDASVSQSESAGSMAAAIEQMTVSINLISSSTQDALARARNAGTAARSGAGVISQTNREMDQIEVTVQQAGQRIDELGQQSATISTIVQVIKDVADQTNLLALNAAIEAARAGEQGRGFAVVADEVRKLAERTTRSASEISQMVAVMQDSARNAITGMDSVTTRVAAGKQLSDGAAGHVEEILGSADQVAHSISEISTALGEQTAVAHDIAGRVETIARMSEGNTHASKETARVSQELNQLAGALRQTAEQFRV
ncbi:methyl-accepting chemotaxis protein [Andreprevotia chitinilytica]|uniref:methyl-accepting chemotaxis protein n=1 Tax=Andreprevotia chitinilytica TaxID=396808 RepID=UPI00068F60AE|nr:methyl-accepting chemotaxis protein [Andreprevotia chitinilytica]